MSDATAPLDKAMRAVVKAAVGCIDKQGYAFRVATEHVARTYFINERALGRLEKAVAELNDARKAARRKKRG